MGHPGILGPVSDERDERGRRPPSSSSHLQAQPEDEGVSSEARVGGGRTALGENKEGAGKMGSTTFAYVSDGRDIGPVQQSVAASAGRPSRR
jgi:hypothetical protein